MQRLDLSANPPASEDVDLVNLGNGDPSAFESQDVNGKAVLVSYNPFTAGQVLTTAEAKGAAAVLLSTPNYYSSLGQQPGPLPDFAAGLSDDPDRLGVVAASVNGTDATDLAQWLAHGPVRIHIGGTDATDLIPTFSSHGPALNSYALKPDLVAPGVEIGSTWPGGGYADDTGTSMAAPHVAGAAALIREAHPDWTAHQIAAALTSGAKLLTGYDATTQGAGRLDVAASDNEAILPSQPTADLGLADLSGPTLNATTTVTFSNVSPHPQTVDLGVQQSGTGVHAVVTPSHARLAAGAQVTARLTLTGKKPATGTNLTGWLRATVTGAPTATVPYLLAVRPLDVHADPDPTPSGATVFVHSEPDLAGAPTVTVDGPGGYRRTATAAFDHTGWWRLTVPAGPAGVYQISATAHTPQGPTLTGQGSFEELAPGGAAWQAVGPDSQGARTLASTSQPGRMFALPSTSPHVGLFRTDDSGANWQELRNLPVGGGVDMGLATDPTQPGTVYLAVEGGGSDPTFQGRILTSTDAGDTWTTLPFPDASMRDLTIDATGRMLAAPAFNGNVYASVDRGQTWTSYPSPGGTPQLARVIGHDLYFAAGSKLYVIRNIDGSPGPAQQIFSGPVSFQNIAFLAGDDNILLAGPINNVFASRDGGVTWQSLLTTPSDDQFLSSVQIVHGDIYATGLRHIWVDRGEGTEWTTMPTPVASGSFTVGTWDPSGQQLVVSASSTGVFVTGDAGASYQRVGLAGADVHALAVDQNAAGQQALLAATTFDNFSTPVPAGPSVDLTTRDWGITPFQSAIGHRVTSLSVDPQDPKVVYEVVANAFSRTDIKRSSDGGATWTEADGVRTSSRGYQVLDDPADPDIVYVTINDPLSPGVVVSRDGGQTWRKNNLPTLVTAIAADPNNPNRIWLGGPDGLFRSDDQGQTIEQLSTSPVTALAVDPSNPSHLLVGGNGLYDSLDSGRTMSTADTSGYRLNVTALLFGAHGTVYAAAGASSDAAGLPVGGRGVLVSRNGGRTWQNISGGLANRDVSSLALSPDGQWLYAGTEGGGVYRVGAG